MKRCIILLLMLTGVLAAQTWTVEVNRPPTDKFFVEQLWSCRITNTEEKSVDVKLYGWIKRGDKEIGHGRSNKITIPPRGKLITTADIKSVQDEWYDSEYEPIAKRRGALPAGVYIICINVEHARSGKILATDCRMHEVKSVSPPKLISPRDGATIEEEFPTFIWTPPVPAVEAVTYILRIAEIPEGITPKEAMERPMPLFEEKDIRKTTFTYPRSARKLEKDKKYIWQVTGLLGKWIMAESEVWSFNFTEVTVRLPSLEVQYAIELISPEDGAVIDTIPTFEWTPVDSPDVSYTLTIWKLPGDLAEKVAEGYTLTEEDLSDLEPYFVKEEIEETSFVYTDTVDNPLVPGFSYCWQVTPSLGDWELPPSEVLSFYYENGPFPHDSHFSIRLISPKNREKLDTPTPRFEWTAVDIPNVDYSLTIWKLPEKLVAKVKEGYTVTGKDLTGLEPYFVKWGIKETSFDYPEDTDSPLVKGIFIAWQVKAWKVEEMTETRSLYDSLFSLTLFSPKNGEDIDTHIPSFEWSGPDQLFELGLTYHFKLFEFSTVSTELDIDKIAPLYEAVLKEPFFHWSDAESNFSPGIHAWRVILEDASGTGLEISDCFWFNFDPLKHGLWWDPEPVVGRKDHRYREWTPEERLAYERHMIEGRMRWEIWNRQRDQEELRESICNCRLYYVQIDEMIVKERPSALSRNVRTSGLTRTVVKKFKGDIILCCICDLSDVSGYVQIFWEEGGEIQTGYVNLNSRDIGTEMRSGEVGASEVEMSDFTATAGAKG